MPRRARRWHRRWHQAPTVGAGAAKWWEPPFGGVTFAHPPGCLCRCAADVERRYRDVTVTLP